MGLDVWAFTEEPQGISGNECDGLTFRDSYGPSSLANWLTRNVDSSARGAWGLAIFTEPVTRINTAEWRALLLDLATRWAAAARRLRGCPTTVGYPEDPGRVVDAQETDVYVEESQALLEFARAVHDNGLRVVVSS